MERKAAFLIVAKEVLMDKRLTVTARLVLAQLLDHRNKRTGQCNPKQGTLAAELGIGLATVERALALLRKLGLVTVKRRQNWCQYEIQIPHFEGSDPSFRGFQIPHFEGSEASGPLYEPYIREPIRPRAEARGRRSPLPDRKPPARQPSLVERTEALIAWRIANGIRPV